MVFNVNVDVNFLFAHICQIEAAKAEPKRDAANCAQICGKAPALNSNATCTKLVPNYELKGGCECLVDYRCCDEKCPSANVQQCWEGGKKGKRY